MATTKKSAAKTSAKSSSKKTPSKTPAAKKWSAKVDTDSTHPDHGLFLKSAPEIAKALASKRVSPGGMGSGMQMLTFYINRAGKNLPKDRVATLNHAKELLSGMIAKKAPAKKAAATKKASAKKAPAKKKTTTQK